MASSPQVLLRVVRGVGITALGAAAITFLFHDWATDALHFYKLLAITTAFSLAGLGVTVWLKEPRGARAFLILSLFAVPLNFAALGGILFATGSSAWLTLAISAPVLAGVTWLGMTALCRPRAKLLAGMLLGSGSVLLLPIRDVATVGAVLAFGTVALTLVDRRLYQTISAVRTPEGWAARLALVFPMVIGVVRTALYYDWMNLAFLTSCLIVASWLLLCVAWYAEECGDPLRGAVVFRWIALGPLAVAALCLPLTLKLSVHRFDVLIVTLAFTIPALVAVGRDRKLLAFSALIGAVGLGLQQLLAVGFYVAGYSPFEQTALCLVVALTGGAYYLVGSHKHSAFVFDLGTVMSGSGIIGALIVAYRHSDAPTWVPLSLLGVALVVGASLAERRGGNLRARYLALRPRSSPPAPRVTSTESCCDGA